MTELIAALLSWIALHTGFAVGAHPEVRLVSLSELTERYHQGGHPHRSGMRVVALYNPATATVYLSKNWKPDSVVDQSKLLHELVHHLQLTNRVPRLCTGELERQAYELQAAWLAEQGVVTPYNVMQVDPFTVKVLSLCGG
ncbi:MAG: hypothetical protein H3C38_06540 [Rhodospirillales bacterium]|nr:hypothetical protein [Rhodospirillales bacterium]